MAAITSVIRKTRIGDVLPPNLTSLRYNPSYFRRYEINVICTPRTAIYERLYNVQYTSYATYTHSILDSKSHGRRIPNRIYSALNSSYFYSGGGAGLEDLARSAPEVVSTGDSSSVPAQPEKSTVEIAYEEYWDEDRIAELERARPELLVRGMVFIPAFTTSESRVVPSAESMDSSTPGRELAREGRRSEKELKIYGFIARNRAFHGDEVVAVKSRRQKAQSDLSTWKETPGECRVVKVLKRSENLSEFVATVNTSDLYDDSISHVKSQPRDSRWPAFRVDKRDIAADIKEEMKRFGPDKRVLCTCSFLDWKFDDMEPMGSIKRVFGETGHSGSEMEATMIFHGLNTTGFGEAVLKDLERLVEHGKTVRNENRHDMNHLFVLSIDPMDAKDLDDALSVEKLEDERRGMFYRIGIHVADVSHYVKEDSLLDLDARNRATSVYMEHQVFPMLPQQLSEDLCSLLPDRERLCFSVFVEVVEAGEGAKIGQDLYTDKVEFKLTTITSKNRLSYDNAKNILTNCFAQKLNYNSAINNPSGNSTKENRGLKRERSAKKSLDLTGYRFRDLEGMISDLGITDDAKIALLRLYLLSQKMRYYRLKQLGAVHVDIDGSIKCHIPKVNMDTSEQTELDIEDEEYFNKKRRLNKRYVMRIERIPRESHELIEEMMLLANTQVARFISNKIDLYFLRVHTDTSKAVKSLIYQVLPPYLKKMVQSSDLSVTQILSKCEEYMDPSAFQSLSFAALQKFKEAFYSPINRSRLPGSEESGSEEEQKEGDEASSVPSEHGEAPREEVATEGRDVADKSNDVGPNYQGHWGLALPVYLHFTSPIRRYSDLHTHRMLKNILFDKVSNNSLQVLSDICQRCNVQKRRAFDAQKEYKNFAFNKYLQFISRVSTLMDPAQLKTLSISKAYIPAPVPNAPEEAAVPASDTHKGSEVACKPLDGKGNAVSDENGGVEATEVVENTEVWGYLYSDACISSIVSTNLPAIKRGDRDKFGAKRTADMGKICLVFYIPLLNEQKSISCEALNLVPVNVHYEKTRRQKQKVKSSILNSYYQGRLGKLQRGDEEPLSPESGQEGKIQGLSAMMGDKRMEFYVYQKARVLLVPGSKMWSVRLPVDYLK